MNKLGQQAEGAEEWLRLQPIGAIEKMQRHYDELPRLGRSQLLAIVVWRRRCHHWRGGLGVCTGGCRVPGGLVRVCRVAGGLVRVGLSHLAAAQLDPLRVELG